MRNLFFLNSLNTDALSIVKKVSKLGRETSIILIQDAINLALKDTRHTREMKSMLDNGVKVLLLDQDVKKRGLEDLLINNVELVDCDSLIDFLFLENQRVINL
jgi:sulfur relay protein TusB/DsrH